MLRDKGNHKPEVSYYFARIQSLMLCTDLVEHKIVEDTKTPLLRRFLSNSKLKPGDDVFFRQYMNCDTFSNLQVRLLHKNILHGIHIELNDKSSETKLL